MFDDTKKENHESYVMVSASRFVSNCKQTFFGSSIEQGGGVELRIRKASVNRSLNTDWFHGEKEMVSIRMTSSQWADFISTMNVGEGVPATLTYFDGKKIEPPPFKSKRVIFEEEFGDDMKNIADKIEYITKNTKEILSAKKALTKADRESILNSIVMLKQEIEKNLPYVQRTFNESMDKTVLEAKSEYENFIATAIQNIGLENIKGIESVINPTPKGGGLEMQVSKPE